MLYLTLFAVSAILLYFAQKSYARWPMMFWVIAYASIAAMCFFSGARDNTIGTDIGVYGLETWHTARSYMGDFWEGSGHVRREPLYFAINYVAAALSNRFGMALFLIQFAMMAFQLHALKRYMDIVPLWLSALVFNLYFFNLNLNLMCQGIAVAVFLWSIRFCESRDFKKLLLCAVICFFIHKSSAIAYATLFGVYYISGKPLKKQGRLIALLAIACVTAVVLYLAVLNYLTSSIPALAQYASYGVGVFKASVSTLDVLMRSMMIAYALIAMRSGLLDKRLALYAIPYFIIDLAIQFLGRYAFFATRIGYYFFAYEIPLSLVIFSRSKLTSRSKFILTSCIVLYFCYYCIRFYFVQRDGETYPYTSAFLGIE